MMKQGKVVVEAGKPLRFQAAEERDSPQSPGHSYALRIADALKAYHAAARDLLKGKYACFAELAPRHLRNPCNTFILRCSDGVFVRYDATAADDARVRAGEINSSLSDIAPQFSEHILYFGTDLDHLHLNEDGPKLTMETKDATGATKESLTFRLGIFAMSQLPEGFQLPKPPARPVCLVSVQNELVLQMNGCIVPADSPLRLDGPDVEQFIVQGRFNYPVGWLAIEVYPILGEQYWQPEHASMWAELDILAIAAQRNLQENQLNALDPRAETRRRYAALLHEFERLLQGPEEPVHQFLRQHPELICPTCDKFWSKLPFGERVSDFVFRERPTTMNSLSSKRPFASFLEEMDSNAKN